MDKWGTSFVARDVVVASLYYESESIYVLLKASHVVYIHAQHLWAVKFLMPPKDHRVSGNDGVYDLTMNILSRIKSIITFLEDD